MMPPYYRSLLFCSEEQMVSCSSSYGNNGCGGGFYINAWNYVMAVGGQVTLAAYPYTSGPGTVTYSN